MPDIDYAGLGITPEPSDTVAFPIDVGRGCPFGCTFCSTKRFWGRKYRLKSPQRILCEVKAIHDRYGITYFSFAHDMFTMNRGKVMETCRLLKTLDFPIAWKCSARIDCIDREMIDAMADAGMREMFIGIETGSQRMQKLVNKNLKLEGVMDLMSYLHGKGIRIIASFIYGFPEETEEDVTQTLALIAKIAKLRNVRIDPHLCTFLPGTELSDRYARELIPAVNFSDITGEAAVEDCAGLIREHPELFLHFREYRTELRDRLEFFRLFVKVWTDMQPVYQYFSESYPSHRLLDMYYDFTRDNRELLEQIRGLPLGEQIRSVLANDRLADRYAHDERRDIILDYYRMRGMRFSEKFRAQGSVTEVFCFSPREDSLRSDLREYQRSLSLVTWKLEESGKIKVYTRTL